MERCNLGAPIGTLKVAHMSLLMKGGLEISVVILAVTFVVKKLTSTGAVSESSAQPWYTLPGRVLAPVNLAPTTGEQKESQKQK